MTDNYFDPATDSPPVAQDTQSTDNSKSGVRKAWDAWSSKPENNASLIQFGIAMMQPRAQGQSAIGAFGNAIGEGAAASDRNVAAQNLEQDRAAQRDERTSTAEYRRAQGAAATTNAAAYSRIADNTGPNAGAKALNGVMRLQQLGAQGFNKWVNTPEDNTTMTKDPILEALKKQFPGIQSKGDILANPQAANAARKIFQQQAQQENPDVSADPSAPASVAPVQAPPSAPTTAPPVPGARWYNGQWYTRGPNGQAVPVPGATQ